MSDLFGVGGTRLLDQLRLGRAYGLRVTSLRSLITGYDQEIAMLGREIATALAGDVGYLAIQAIPGWGRCWRRCSWPRSAMCIASPAPPSCAPGPGSRLVTVSRTPPCAAAPSPTGPPAGPLGCRGGHPAAAQDKQAGRRLPPHRRPARHRHRPRRGRPQAADPGLLRLARRPGPLPGTKGGDVNGSGAARRVLVCVMTPARRRGRPFD
jgi:hypothetical protein